MARLRSVVLKWWNVRRFSTVDKDCNVCHLGHIHCEIWGLRIKSTNVETAELQQIAHTLESPNARRKAEYTRIPFLMSLILSNGGCTPSPLWLARIIMYLSQHENREWFKRNIQNTGHESLHEERCDLHQGLWQYWILNSRGTLWYIEGPLPSSTLFHYGTSNWCRRRNATMQGDSLRRIGEAVAGMKASTAAVD